MAGWVSRQTPGPYQPADPGPGGFLVRSKLPSLAWSQDPLRSLPVGSQGQALAPKQAEGSGLRMECQPPGEDPWPRDNGQQKGLTVSFA